MLLVFVTFIVSKRALHQYIVKAKDRVSVLRVHILFFLVSVVQKTTKVLINEVKIRKMKSKLSTPQEKLEKSKINI